MPIREYRCNKCRDVFELIELGPKTERVTCLRCGSRKVTRQFSAFSTWKSEKSSCEVSKHRG